MARLAGKVAVITGGAGGIGRAAGRLFAAEGARVLLVDVNEGALQQTVDDIAGGAASYAVADTTQPVSVRQFLHTAVERYGGLDVLLANAGVEGELHAIADYPVEVFDHVMAVNVRGVWLGVRCLITSWRSTSAASGWVSERPFP